MKRVMVVFLVAFAPACVAVDSPQNEPEDTPSGESTLASDIDSWCDSTCARISDCPEECDCAGDVCTCRGGVSDDCAEDCRDTLEEYLGQGDDCAAIGQALMSCVDGISTCEQLYGGYDCNDPPNVEAACGLRRDDDGDDDDDDEPPSVTPPGDRYVTCRAGSGGGTAGAAGGGNVSDFQCDSLYEECNDGGRYQLVCNGTTQTATCNCFRNGEFTGSFDTTPARCPAGVEINTGCGWNLDPGF